MPSTPQIPQWARDYFERGYAQRWDLPPVSDRVRLETAGLWEQLELREGAWVLDLGCGHGRHALALAQRGANVVGADFAQTLLNRAKTLAADLAVSPHWLRGDMRQLPLRSNFFAAATLIDAFGFFQTDEENEAVLAEVWRVLAPGGRFALKVVNGAPILAAFRETGREEREGVVVAISRRLTLEPARMTEKVIVTGSRGDGEYERHQRLYNSEELSDALRRTGFTGVEIFADPDRSPFEPVASSTMWAFGRRTAHVARQWTQIAPAWIREVRNGRNAMRAGLLDKPMLAACGDVTGLNILDCGCGEGRFSRMLVDRGAGHVLGVDSCESMIAAARELQGARDAYRVGDAQGLSFLEDRRFDLAVSYLNQCDLPDFEANNREIARVLKPGGRFVIANLHPMRSATGAWQRAENGLKQHAILDHYFDEGERRWTMLGSAFTNFHRALSTYIRGYRQAGFTLDDMIEPTVDAETRERFPELDDELRVPNFIILALRRE